MKTEKKVTKVLSKNFFYTPKNPLSVEEVIKRLQKKGVWK